MISTRTRTTTTNGRTAQDFGMAKGSRTVEGDSQLVDSLLMTESDHVMGESETAT
jgi:hypothetical protein